MNKYLYGMRIQDNDRILLGYSKNIKELQKLKETAKKLNYGNFEIRG